jgi:lipopolysaccharide export system permease protein
VGFGILQRYVMSEVMRAFLMALFTMTVIFVLFMVMAEASKFGLSPRDIAHLVPLVIPSTLPFTVPVSLLFAVTVVYGRLASDNEIIAVKTSGKSVMIVLWPTLIMGIVLSSALFYLSREWIPIATFHAKIAIIKDFEDGFYKWLNVQKEFNNPSWPFFIKVRDVDLDTRVMYEPTFKHRTTKDPGQSPYDVVIQASKAIVKFDMDRKEPVAHIYLEGAQITSGKSDDAYLIDGKYIEMPIPDNNKRGYEKRLQEWTVPEMVAEQASNRRLLARERKRQAIAASLWVASGRIERIDWPGIDKASNDYSYWLRRIDELETEIQFRTVQAFGSLAFVLIGAPIGIRFARGDFLSAFITCFMPIIVVYYPLMLFSVNLGKEGLVNPGLMLWSGNLLFVAIAAYVFPPVWKH